MSDYTGRPITQVSDYTGRPITQVSDYTGFTVRDRSIEKFPQYMKQSTENNEHLMKSIHVYAQLDLFLT